MAFQSESIMLYNITQYKSLLASGSSFDLLSCLNLITSIRFHLNKVLSLHHAGMSSILFNGECSVFKKIILWMKTIHYPNIIKSHLVTIVPIAPFTPKSTSRLRSALHIRYSIVIRRFISCAN